jgi:hypothetical protein
MRTKQIVLALAIGSLLAADTRAAPAPDFAGVWCWGSQRRSADVPFLRISRGGGNWRVETKHYMHARFVDRVKDLRIDGNGLEFRYWYEPLQRWARCSFVAQGHTMAGVCEGEVDARTWGDVPSFLWRIPSSSTGGTGE